MIDLTQESLKRLEHRYLSTEKNSMQRKVFNQKQNHTKKHLE